MAIRRRPGVVAGQPVGPVPAPEPAGAAVRAAVSNSPAGGTGPGSPENGGTGSSHAAPVAVEPRAITAIANQANAALGLVGITGSGKTSLAITAVEEAWEVYHRRTQWYASDLGGWGNKLLSLIRLGIVRVWYIRNHANPFETMELASQGYWPEMMQDLETGLAAPDVRLIPPRRVRWLLICPNDHVVASYDDQAQVAHAQQACPTCGTITTTGNALRVDRVVVRSAGFKSIGHYVYDSMTQMSEYGLIELRGKSARGELPTGGQGGSALGSADALREGSLVLGTGSKAQYGFMQDRVPVWISNIRGIPDQTLPPTITFGVERSKGDDESGGMPIYGPKIAGNARTAWVPGWLGNCLYVAKEPHNPPEKDEHGNVVTYHRLWLVNHVTERDPDTPIVAKHRGEPIGMPSYLEDSGKPEEAWQRCSLRVFYELLRAQAVMIEARDKAKFADAPGLSADDEPEEVLEIAAQGEASAAQPTSARVIRRSRRPGAHAAQPVTQPVLVDATTAVGPGDPAAPVVEQAAAPRADVPPAPIAGEPPSSEAPSPIMAQLTASLEESRKTLEAQGMLPPPTPAGNGEVHAAVAAYDKDRDQAPPRPAHNRIKRVPRPPAE